MKVTRADWAGSVPWAGITGKPDALSSTAGASDLAQLTARVAALEALLSASSGASDSPITTLHVEWVIDPLASLQMGYEDITLTGLQAGTACVLVPQDPLPYLMASATALAPSTVRLTAMNVGPLAITPGLTVWTLFVLNG
jgi:hypothetical protein